ncbi:hypothetical protein QBC38DRAFT_504759 [Podospora fimiseda]|uniref:C2H2-type domain-containing protein n=1 Tax=Podospora fimiseda TaxID=252190 RepID=A0AAN7BF46_9PEZI|nr:hypothetical protein QBC38DRAFT_504759 [Podospora fimiseda]
MLWRSLVAKADITVSKGGARFWTCCRYKQMDTNDTGPGQERVRIFCQIIDCYLGSQTTQLKHLIRSLENNKPDVSSPKGQSIVDGMAEKNKPIAVPFQDQEDTDLCPPAWTCLLCETSFVQRAGLTRHNQFQHYNNRGTFDQPLPCPRCGPKYTLNGA